MPIFVMVTVCAALLASLIAVAVMAQRLREIAAVGRSIRETIETDEMNKIFLSSAPFIVNIWDDSLKLLATSPQAVRIFGLKDQRQYIELFDSLSPEFQPCGTRSAEKAAAYIRKAFEKGSAKFEWMHQTLGCEPVPCEIALVRFRRGNRNRVVAYTVDLRPVKAAMKREYEASKMNEILLNSAPFVMNLWDSDFRLISTTRQSLELFELSQTIRGAPLDCPRQRFRARCNADEACQTVQLAVRILQQVLIAQQQEARLVHAGCQPAAHVLTPGNIHISGEKALRHVPLNWIRVIDVTVFAAEII